MATPIIKYKGLKTTIKLPQNLWYSNQSTIQSIAIDFDNGVGYVAIPFNASYELQYTQEGVKNWKYKLTLTNGQILYSQNRIIFEETLYDASATNLQRTINQPCLPNTSGIDRVEFVGTQMYLGTKNTATLEIKYKDNDCKIKKPLIVAEGFDSGLLGAENSLGDNDFKDFIDEATILTGNLDNEIANYDIIYVNWDKGKDYLQRNALLLEDIIQWVNEQKALAGSLEKNVVLGQSMGGVIARYALADMEQRNLVHDTKLYISHDAPHQGVNIPLGLQYFAQHLADQFIGTPLGDFSFAVSDGGNASIEDLSALLNAIGTKQLLDNYITTSFGLDNSIHDAWQTDLLSKGYPTQTRNIAISNGSHCAITQDFNYNSSLFSMNGNARTGILADILGSTLGISDDIVLAVIFNEPALLLGVLPGSSKFNLDFNAKVLPIANQSANIYKGKVSFTKKLFWVANITLTLTDRSYNNPVYLSYDKYAGGRYELFGQISDIDLFNDNYDNDNDGDNDLTQFQADLFNLLATANINFNVEKTFGFIPTPSALDVGRGIINLNNDDYLRAYTAANPPTGDRAIPFHNFITAYQSENSINERHISFNTKNGNWLATELDNIVNNNEIFDCSFICSDAKINGVDNFCNSSVFTVPNTANTYTWSITSTNNLAVISSEQGTNSVVLSAVNPNLNGFITISCYIGNFKCGYATIVKRIHVGRPTIESFIPIQGAYSWVARGYANNHSVYVTPIEATTSYRWEIIMDNEDFTNYDCTGVLNPSFAKFNNNGSTVTPTTSATYTSNSPNADINWGRCSGSYILTLTAINECGETEATAKYVTVGKPEDNPCNNSGTFETSMVTAAPNPIEEDETIVINVAPNYEPCDLTFTSGEIGTTNKEVIIYDLQGNQKYYNNLPIENDKININNHSLKKRSLHFTFKISKRTY